MLKVMYSYPYIVEKKDRMTNYNKFKILVETMNESQLRIKQLLDERNDANDVIRPLFFPGFTWPTKNIVPSMRTISNDLSKFNSTFLEPIELFELVDKHLNSKYSGDMVLTSGRLNVDGFDEIDYSFFNGKLGAGTNQWHTHRSFAHLTRSLTIHFPIWYDMQMYKSIDDVNYYVDILHLESVKNDLKHFRMLKNSDYFDEIEKNKNSIITLKGKRFSILDFNSSAMHRGQTDDNVILASIVLNYKAKNENLDEVISFHTNLDLDELKSKIPNEAKRSINLFAF